MMCRDACELTGMCHRATVFNCFFDVTASRTCRMHIKPSHSHAVSSI